MPSTPALDLNTSYAADAAAATERVHAETVDSDHNALQVWAAQLLEDLSLVIRDDDTLVDGIVRSRNLHQEILTLIAANADWQPKPAVACASTANLTLSGEQTVDTILTSASRVLVKDQTNAEENGIYVTAAGAWSRATDADTAAELGFAFTLVTGGDTNAGTTWVVNALPADITLGTTDVTWVQTGGPTGLLTVVQGGTGKRTAAGWATAARLLARVVVVSAISVGAPGATLDSVTMVAGDRVLLVAQASGAENGIWQWNGAAVAMTRPTDYSASSTLDAYQNTIVPIGEGTIFAGSIWRLTTSGAITIGGTVTAWSMLPLFPGPFSKGTVRTAGIVNVNIAAPGATINGYNCIAGDRILLTAQSTTSQNGIWQWNGAASALTRTSDYPTGSTVACAKDTWVYVTAGFYGTMVFRQIDSGVITIGTTATTWVTGIPAPTFAGGTGQSNYVLGDILYASAADVLSRLGGNVFATRKFLRQLGTGLVSAAPAWDTLVENDLPRMSLRDTARKLVVAYSTAASVDISADEIYVQDASTQRRLQSFSTNVAITTSGLDGLDTGVEAVSTWYHLWVIYNPTTFVAGGLLSLSSSAPTLPSGFTHKSYVGAVRNDGSGNFVRFSQRGHVVHCAKQNVFTNTAPGVADTYENIAVTQIPPTAGIALGNIGASAASKSGMAVAADTNGVGETVNRQALNATISYNYSSVSPFRVALLTAQQVSWKAMDTSASWRMDICGWEYH